MIETFLGIGMTALPTSPECGEALQLVFTATNPMDDQYITAVSIVITMVPGQFPTSLADGFTGVTFTCTPGWSISPNGGVFTATPNTPADARVGPHGVYFNFDNIVVNDEVGITDITIKQTIEPENQTDTPPNDTHTDIKPLNKIAPPLALHWVKATPPSTVYGGASVISWEASVGAFISLDDNGVTINSAKGQPGVALASAGNYEFDKLTEQTTVTVTATAGPSAAASAPTQLQAVVNIKAPTATLTATIVPVVNAPPNAVLTWTTTSASTATLVSTPVGLAAPTDPFNGTVTTPFLMPTQYNITATNTAVQTPATVSQSVAPPAFDWVPVGPGPFSAANICVIAQTHAGLAVAESNERGSEGTFWISSDGLQWSQVVNMPPIHYVFPVYVTHFGGTTFVSAGNTGPDGGNFIWSTTDFITWTELPASPAAAALLSCPITFDAAGNAWTMSIGSAPKLWKSSDQMQSWVQVSALSIPQIWAPSLTFMNGQLWLIGPSLDTATTYCAASSDGITWVQHPAPAGLTGFCSPNLFVFKNQICLFIAPIYTAVPMALWRIDANGTWTQDAATPGQSIQSTGGFPTSIAQCGGTLFTISNGHFAPTSGIWARTT